MAVLTWYINLPILECTADKHLVFAIRDNSASIPVDPTKLVVQGSPNCKPVIVNNKVAIFKFKVDECGVRTYVSLISFTLSFTGQKKKQARILFYWIKLKLCQASSRAGCSGP